MCVCGLGWIFLWVLVYFSSGAFFCGSVVWNLLELFFTNNYLWIIFCAYLYVGSSVSSTKKDIDTWLAKAWAANDKLSVTWKSDLTDKMKRSFSQAAVVSILLYGCTTWTLIKWMEKKLDGNYTRMLQAILNKPWRQHPTKQQMYGPLSPITKTIKVRKTRHEGHWWRSGDELIRDVLQWTSSYSQSGRTYIQQLCEDTRSDEQ